MARHYQHGQDPLDPKLLNMPEGETAFDYNVNMISSGGGKYILFRNNL